MAEILLFCVAAATIISATQGSTVNFTFPPKTYIKTEGQAYFQSANEIQLTLNLAAGSLASSFGWVTYVEPLPLWDKISGAIANFSTHFQFTIGRGNDLSNGYGDGLAFFLSSFDLTAESVNSTGGGIGVLNDTIVPYQIVAVEFDTFKNSWDVDDNHVAIDVSSVFSNATFSLSNASATVSNRSKDEDLKNGEQWDVWVDYDGGKKILEVFLLYNPDNNLTKPEIPILSFAIDLSKFLPENVKIGLSASTGSFSETHSITFWSFTSQNSWSAKMEKKIRTVKIALISVFVPLAAICGVILVGIWCYYKHRKFDNNAADPDAELDECFAQGPRRFSYSDLASATGNFSEENKLGRGGFGEVFKGTLTQTLAGNLSGNLAGNQSRNLAGNLAGSAVAVKRISQGSKQGRKEYISEVTIISKLRHRNLVELLGWCHQRDDFLLVYEFLPNGSLDRYIFEDCKLNLCWKQRFSIACDIASALVYLHEECDQRVVHRDVKASNVMLDSNFTAKLGDFGLARFLERERMASHTTVVAGTFGYLAPECVATGKASPETDVFSFGAVTLEIACGRRAVDRTLGDYNSRLVEWVWDLHSQGRILDAVDERLNVSFDLDEMKRLMGVGLLCSHPDSKARPGMRQVLKMLKSEAELPYIPSNFPVAVYNDNPGQLLLCSMTSMTLNASSSISGGGSLSSRSSGHNAASPLFHAD